MRKWSLFSVVFLSIITFVSSYASMLDDEYFESRDIVLTLLNRFPPEKYFYVGLGRSPVPIMFLLEELNLSNTANIPLSGISNMDGVWIGDQKVTVVSPEELNARRLKLFDHYRKFLPKLETLKGRKILLIDFVDSGKGLINAKQTIEEYYNMSTEAVALYIEEKRLDDPIVTQLVKNKINVYYLASWRSWLRNQDLRRLGGFTSFIHDLMKRSRYHLAAPYGEAIPWEDSINLNPGIDRQNFVNRFRSKALADKYFIKAKEKYSRRMEQNTKISCTSLFFAHSRFAQ